MGYIVDLSHHQEPRKIDYDKLAKQLDLAIIRTQYGSLTIDRHYKAHHTELRKRGVPTAAYAWVRGVSVKDMEVEATDFYNRTKDLNPTFWFLDVEEKSMEDMRSGITAYIKKLRSLGAKKIGVYIAHHLYKSFNLDLSLADAIWIPHYGKNNGQVNSKPDYPCDLHQYTSVGHLEGYGGNLDLNRLTGTKPLAFFTGVEKEKETKPKTKPKKQDEKYTLVTSVKGYLTAADAKNRKNDKAIVAKGTYHVFNKSQGMINVTTKKGVPGSWINPKASKQAASAKAEYHIVKKSDTVSGIAAKYKTTVAAVQKLNPNIKNIHLIYPNQKIRVK